MLASNSEQPAVEHTSTYPLSKLLSLWKSSTMTPEQLCGHLLQHIILLEKRLATVEKLPKENDTPAIVISKPA